MNYLKKKCIYAYKIKKKNSYKISNSNNVRL